MTEPDVNSVIGTIVGSDGGYVIVQLDSGEEVLCRNAKRLHRPLGFLFVPFGRRARISYTRGSDKMPLLVEVLKQEVEVPVEEVERLMKIQEERDKRRWPTREMPTCPQCGKRLGSEKARQCFECGADWH